jgi:hypothetical protein
MAYCSKLAKLREHHFASLSLLILLWHNYEAAEPSMTVKLSNEFIEH